MLNLHAFKTVIKLLSCLWKYGSFEAFYTLFSLTYFIYTMYRGGGTLP